MPSPYGLEITESCLRCKLRVGRLFCNLPRPTLETLQTLGITTACPKGNVLFSQGQSPHEISVLCLGHVKVSTASQTGRTVCLGIAEPGAVLGLSATISGKPYEVSIEALEPCQLKVIGGDRFLNFLRDDRAACLAVLKCLSNDVRKAYEPVRLFGLSHSATEKLANVNSEGTLRGCRCRIRLREIGGGQLRVCDQGSLKFLCVESTSKSKHLPRVATFQLRQDVERLRCCSAWTLSTMRHRLKPARVLKTARTCTLIRP